MNCTLQWSLSGHQHVCLSNSKRPSHRQLTKTSNGRHSQLNQYWSYKPHSNFKPTWIFWRFCMCTSNDTFDKNKKSWCWYWDSTAKTESLLEIKQTKVIPNENWGCAPLTANRTSADCVQISLRPSIPYIPLGVYHTGGFNAMGSDKGLAPNMRQAVIWTNDGLVNWRIYASLELNWLSHWEALHIHIIRFQNLLLWPRGAYISC